MMMLPVPVRHKSLFLLLMMAMFTTVAVVHSFVLPTPTPTATAMATGKAPFPRSRIQQRKQSQSQLDMSDIPRDSDNDSDNQEEKGEKFFLDWWKSMLPPPPEDQFIMTGDVSVLFLYAFISHNLNNFVVESVFSNSDTLQEAIESLDPKGEVIQLQSPVWVMPEFQDSVMTATIQDSLLDHWGPLFSTAGSASVALCTCWLIAGWWHRAFLFQNSLDCDASEALQKTVSTWITMAILMCGLTYGSNALVSHVNVPVLETWLGSLGCASTSCRGDYLFTKADAMFLVDSSTVLIAWRFMANSMMNYFR
jgi:hypothetical protein